MSKSEYREIRLGGSEFVGLKRAEAELARIDGMLDKAGVRRLTPKQAVLDRVYDLLNNGSVARSATLALNAEPTEAMVDAGVRAMVAYIFNDGHDRESIGDARRGAMRAAWKAMVDAVGPTAKDGERG